MNHEPTHQLPGDDSEVRFEAAFPDTSPDRLFGYFTKPELLVQWWPQTAEVVPQAGGRYELAWPAMGWRLYGEYTEFEPGRRLGFTWQWDHQPELPVRQVDVEFTPAGDGTRLRLMHGVYGEGEAEAADRQSHIDGWLFFLSRLQEVASG